jgi:drug/metabolite transporter (DMT)-like permease
LKEKLLKKAGIYPVLVLSMLFWGLSFVWTSVVFRYYQPITTIFIRLVLSSTLLFGYMILSGRFEKIRRKDIPVFLFTSFVNPFLYFLGESYGLKNTSPTISAVVIATIPVFMPLVAWFTLRERLSGLNLAGIFISFAGIAIMLVNPDLSLNASPYGVLLLLGAVAAAITYSVFLKRLTSGYSALAIITWQNLAGALFFLPLFLIFEFDHFRSVKPNAELVTSILQLTFFASTLAYIFYTQAVKVIGVSRSSVFSNLIPVFTAVFSAIFISEIFPLTKIAGMAIVIGGVLLSQIKFTKPDSGKQTPTTSESKKESS